MSEPSAGPDPVSEPVADSAARPGSARSLSAWISAARTFTGLLTIGIPLVLVRALPQSEFGYYKQIFLVALTAQTLFALGIPGSLYYFVPRDREGGHRFQTQSVWMLVILGLLAAALVLLGSSGIQRLFHAELGPYIPLLALFVALAVPASLMPVPPMVDRRPRVAAGMVVFLDLVRAALLIAVALLTRSLYWVVAAGCLVMALQLGLVVGYLLRVGPRSSWRPETKRLKEQLAYALPFSGAAAIGFTRQKIHAYYVAATFTASEFAVYAAATLHIPLISRLSQTIGEVVVLENAAHHSAGKLGEMRRVWHRASHLLGLVLIPVWVLAEAFAPELIRLLYGEPYAGATPIFRVFLFLLPLSVFLGSPMLRAVGDTRQMVVADVIALAVAIGVLVAFAGPFGPLAAVGSLVAGKAAYMLAAAGRTASRLGLGVRSLLPWRLLGGVLGVSAVSASLALVLSDVVGLEGTVRLLAGGPIGAVSAFGALWWTGLIPESERRWIAAGAKGLLRSLMGRDRTARPAAEAQRRGR